MIRSFREMQGSHIKALDGEIGKLKDVYFDDRSSNLMYFVVELGSWLSGRVVLVPPAVVSPFDGTCLKVQLTKAELQECSHADSEMPISLQQLNQNGSIFNMVCTTTSFMIGGPIVVLPIIDNDSNMSNINPHLRSCKSVCNYELVAQTQALSRPNFDSSRHLDTSYETLVRDVYGSQYRENNHKEERLEDI